MTFRYQLSEWTFLYLLSFGEYVQIIEPVEARNILKEKAQKPDSYIDENGKEQIYENTVFINGKEVKVGKVTDEEVKNR